MNYFHTCPLCGANLDPGERCDCADNWMKIELHPYADEGGGTERRTGHAAAEIYQTESGHV